MSKSNTKFASKVEGIAVKNTGQKIIYEPIEKINTIVVDNFPALGKLTAMRFLEWAQQNEGWTISLPTGKTPEHFIKWVTYLLTSWNDKKAQKLLEENGIDPAQSCGAFALWSAKFRAIGPIRRLKYNQFVTVSVWS